MMKTSREVYNHVSRIALVSALALGMAATAHAQAEKAGGPREGITVHGHWTIEVRNPDGTVVQRQEFENALSDGGSSLGRLLGRIGAVGFWTLTASDGQASPCQGGTYSNDCEIVETGTASAISGTNVFRNLNLSNAGNNQVQVILRGSATALVAGRISSVSSNFGVCSGQVPPGACGGRQAIPFTQATLPTAVPVAAGQIIQISMVITFS